jgi:3-oxosteroid 1-dehydrogenase
MVASIYAHDHGARVLLIEKTDLYGGNSAMSGGAMWIPNNPQMAAAGVRDSREEALTYLEHITHGRVAVEKLETYVDTAPEMLAYMTEHTHLRPTCMLTYPDYYAEAPGGKPGGRSLEPEHFDASRLGDEFLRMREPALQELVFGRMSMTATEAHHLLARHPGWIKLTSQIMARYYKDVGWRLRSKRDRCLSLGNALVGMLRRSLMDRDIPIWFDTVARELIVEDGRVVGVAAERVGRPVRIRARNGVLLAAGGFESNQEMRDKYLPQPSKAEWTSGSPASTGDAIRMGQAVGAALDLMEEAWWSPTTVVPGEARARVLVIEKGLPGCILVNKKGRRFVNEASPYSNIVQAMYAKSTPEAPSAPAYMIFDAEYRRKYPFGPLLQAAQQPDWMIPKALRSTYLEKADTLRELARRLGVDPDGLEFEVARFNDNARAGTDPDFHRGEGGFDSYYGDANVKPNPCLAPLAKAPFYGIEAYPGEFGTKGGLKTDTRARVLDESGRVIEGLYASGNCSASVMGPTYPGAGGTIGPAMTFSFIAAREVVAAREAGEGAADEPLAPRPAAEA